ncbi:MAG TPA: HPF/RaiA family ribosome-associated protein [Candidatus Saccharimonadales bacterium]|nr:HPF/RaiA family ribosome-associated protein [Candidatus Saccharimonadales bacterium]
MHVTITATGLTPNSELQKYAKRKIAEVTRRVPLKVKAEAIYTVQLAQKRSRGQTVKTCTLALTLPDAEFTATETTQHMFAALDIATANIRTQLRAYTLQKRREARRARLDSGADIDET